MSWSFTLRWLPSGPAALGIPVDLDGRPHNLPPIPWWSDSVKVPEAREELFEPYYVGATIVAEADLYDAFAEEYIIPDASKRSWVCRHCGKISLTNWLGNYVCSYCDRNVRQTIIIIQGKLTGALTSRSRVPRRLYNLILFAIGTVSFLCGSHPCRFRKE